MKIDNDYLREVYNEFNIRLAEATAYIEFVANISEADSPIIINNKSWVKESDMIATLHKYQISTIDRQLSKTLRASSYLVLYNLLESTMSGAINAIHETIKNSNIDIMDLSECLYVIILTNLQKGLSQEKISQISKENTDYREQIFELGYNKKKLFSGNIDCQVIDSYCRKYGFEVHPCKDDKNRPITWDPKVIKHIKQKRNNLAHGSESFEDCGQNMAIEHVRKNLIHVKAILLGVFNGLNHYMDNQKYLKSTNGQKT